MRHVDTSTLIIPANWLTLAKAKYGNSYVSLWSYHKANIESLIGKKCWFSESQNIGSDNDIEHFRPKAANVKALTKKYADLDTGIWAQLDVNTRNGYSFLTYEFANYRYACTFVNSLRRGSKNKVRGKSNFFPLQINSPLATCLGELATENSCLLDPCNIDDPEKITFTMTGSIEPHIMLLKNSWEYCRVMTSIELYHLQYYRFEERRRIIWDECKDRIELADELYASLRTQLEIKNFKVHIEILRKKAQKTSEFSAVAIDCIRFYKSKIQWLEIFFPDHSIIK